jgi:hypothetical protein
MDGPISAAPGSGTDTPPGQWPEEHLAKFVEQVQQRFHPEHLESFWTLEEDFRQLAAGGFATAWLNAELERVRSDPAYMGDWRPNRLMVQGGRGWHLSIRLIEASSTHIHSNPSLAMYTPVGAESLRYNIYRLPEEYDNTVFDPTLQLEPAGLGITAPGGVLLQSERFVYDFHTARPVTVLSLATAPFQTLEWLFSRNNLHALQANDSELASTRLRVVAYVLGRMARPSSVESLRELASHPHHAVRWAAIQNLGRVSRSAVIPVLEQAVNDPHPHVRRAAVKTLRQLTPAK